MTAEQDPPLALSDAIRSLDDVGDDQTYVRGQDVMDVLSQYGVLNNLPPDSHEFEDVTNRGFGITEFYYRDYDNTGEQHFSVQESSLATERKVWIGPGDERAHLNEDEARRVRDALSAFLGE